MIAPRDHALAHRRRIPLARLRAEPFIMREWCVAYPSGKQLSVVAQAFLTHLRVEAPAIRGELSLPRRLRRAILTATPAPH